jgi:hypothetical protein
MAPPNVAYMQSVVQRRRELAASAKSQMDTSPQKRRQQDNRMLTLSQPHNPSGSGDKFAASSSRSPTSTSFTGTKRISKMVQGGRTFFKVEGNRKLYWSESEAETAAAPVETAESSRAFR